MHPLADTGRVIAGRYRLQAPIGRGAMGVVWRARDQLLDRDVAVKEVQISDTLTDHERAQAYQRTLREAKTAARLNHPAVVTVYDVAEDEGRPWIVMQLINAQSLDQVLATSGPLAPRRVAEIGRQLLSALTVAHAAGVMHRDVKPSNVLLGLDDRAVLTDFGIATFAGDPKLTQTGMVMGSPGFTAPERIRGEDASPASDLWSLGATLFAAVEGHGPFEQRGGALTTMSAIINEDAPGAASAGALAPVIAALLRREPSDRPDAGQAARMIAEVLPQLADRTSGTPAGYAPTALSASPPAADRPAADRPGADRPYAAQHGAVQPGAAEPYAAEPYAAEPYAAESGAVQPGGVPASAGPPGAPQPNETVMDVASAEQTLSREPSGLGSASTGPPGGQQTPAPTAPIEPASALGDAARYGSSARPEAPAPDFSSWYDPSPRSGPATPPGSGSASWSGSAPGPGSAPWSGSQYPAPLGYGPGPQPGSASQPGPASYPGSASQPGSGSVPWSGAQPGYASGRRRRSGLWWKIALVVLAVIGAGAGTAVVLLIHHNDTAAGHGTASSSSTSTLPPSALQIVDAINKQSTGTLPAGYSTYSQPAAADEKAGFSLAAPTSWKASTSGYQTYLRDATLANVNLLVDLTPHTFPDNMLKEATYIRNHSMSRFPGYKQLGLAGLTIRGQPGAYWKFTWDDAGVQQEAIDLLYVAPTSAGQQSYALYMTAPASEWSQMRPVFDEAMETFNPMP
jgi:tRNA A-37 threonylcarbamoyl transferase component Bud32